MTVEKAGRDGLHQVDVVDIPSGGKALHPSSWPDALEGAQLRISGIAARKAGPEWTYTGRAIPQSERAVLSGTEIRRTLRTITD